MILRQGSCPKHEKPIEPWARLIWAVKADLRLRLDLDAKIAMISRMPKCVFERVCEVARTSNHHLPISGKGDDGLG
jgi:hypothetical protein